jgi:hypothetical protein
MVLLKSSMLFSQKPILDNKDTLICFTPPECKLILKEFSRANYLDTLSKIQSKEIYLLKTSNKELQEMIDIKTSQLKLSQDLSKIKDVEIERLVVQKEKLKKEITRQKTHKIIGIIAGSISTAFMTYLWIAK